MLSFSKVVLVGTLLLLSCLLDVHGLRKREPGNGNSCLGCDEFDPDDVLSQTGHPQTHDEGNLNTGEVDSSSTYSDVHDFNPVMNDVESQLQSFRTSANEDYPAISIAAFNGRNDIIEKLLDDWVDVNERDPNGMTPLMLAVANSQWNTVSYLLRHGADILATDKWGKTAYRYAKGEQCSTAAGRIRNNAGAISDYLKQQLNPKANRRQLV